MSTSKRSHRKLVEKSPTTSGKKKRKKGDQFVDLMKTADDLDAISSALTNTSKELLTPPPSSQSKATCPPSSIFLATEQTKEQTVLSNSVQKMAEKCGESSNHQDASYERKLSEITEDVDAAIILSTALRDRLIAIKTKISSREQMFTFNDEIREKVELISTVAKKGMALRKVNEYRIVDASI